MITTLLILGRPGSGKTTAFRTIQSYLEKRGWSVIRFRDYEILHEMFLAETQALEQCPQCANGRTCFKHRPRFRPTAHAGFDVIELSALQDVLLILENHVKCYAEQLRKEEQEKNVLLAIEFARDTYDKGDNNFTPSFLKNTHILFVDSHLEKCIQRIEQRVYSEEEGDKHYVSSYIMRKYYHIDNRPYMRQQALLNANMRQSSTHCQSVVEFITNDASRECFSQTLEQFTQTILDTVMPQQQAQNDSALTNCL